MKINIKDTEKLNLIKKECPKLVNSALKGDEWDIYYLATIFIYGKHSHRDVEQGLELMETLSKNKNIYAMSFLAEAYFEGRYVDRDDKKATEILLDLKKGSNLDYRASFYLGRLMINGVDYGDGVVVKKDINYAIELLNYASNDEEDCSFYYYSEYGSYRRKKKYSYKANYLLSALYLYLGENSPIALKNLMEWGGENCLKNTILANVYRFGYDSDYFKLPQNLVDEEKAMEIYKENLMLENTKTELFMGTIKSKLQLDYLLQLCKSKVSNYTLLAIKQMEKAYTIGSQEVGIVPDKQLAEFYKNEYIRLQKQLKNNQIEEVNKFRAKKALDLLESSGVRKKYKFDKADFDYIEQTGLVAIKQKLKNQINKDSDYWIWHSYINNTWEETEQSLKNLEEYDKQHFNKHHLKCLEDLFKTNWKKEKADWELRKSNPTLEKAKLATATESDETFSKWHNADDYFNRTNCDARNKYVLDIVFNHIKKEYNRYKKSKNL